MSITKGAFSLSCGVTKRPALESDSHGLLETRFDQIKHRLRHFVIVGGLRLAFDPEWQRRVVNHRAGAERDGNSLHAGNRSHLVVELAQAGASFGGGGGGRRRHRQTEGDGVAGIESRIHAPQRGEAAQHQPRADQENQSHGDFDRHKDSLQPVTRAARAAAAFLEDLLQVHPRTFRARARVRKQSRRTAIAPS